MIIQLNSFERDLLKTSLLESIETLEKHPGRNNPIGGIKENFDKAIVARRSLISKIQSDT